MERPAPPETQEGRG